MSNKEYYQRWLKFKEDFKLGLIEDERIQELATGLIGIKPQATAVELVSRVYCKYCDFYNRLCDCYDQMQQPQRRIYIKKIIDAITCRIIELKETLEEVEVFEYTYPENALQQMLMVPQDIQIMCPFFYPFEIRQEEMQYIVDQILSGNRLGDPTPTPSEIERKEEERLEEERIKQEEKEAMIRKKLALGEEIEESVSSVQLSPEELEELRSQEEYIRNVSNIQRMERCRKISREKIRKFNKDANLYLELAGLKAPEAKESQRIRAASFIQRIYRRFMELKREHVHEQRLKTKLNMVIPSHLPPSAKVQLEKVKEVRREFRRKYHEKWIAENIKEKSRILRFREGDIMEDISTEIRAWFQEWYDDVRCFDEFPYAEEGGTILVVRGETFSIGEFIEWKIAEEKRLKAEASNPKSKEDIKGEKLAAKEEKKRIQQEAKAKELKRIIDYKKQRMHPDNDPGVYINEGKFVTPIQEAWFNYENQWAAIDTPDAALDAIKGHIMQLIVENMYQDVQLELRPIVDEMMRLELQLLRNALKNDLNAAGITKMPLVKKRKKPRKQKPPKPDKGIPARLFQTLVDEGIVKKYPRLTLDEFWGDQNYAAADSRAVLWTPTFPPPCIGDVKELIRIRCILTLGCTCPKVQRTHLLVGPKGSGKKSLIYAVATETNSILIDLSPMNVYNKFPGPKLLKTMFNLVNRVSRLMQPTIIMVDNAEKIFYKKVPKEEKEFDPTRLAKDFYKEIIKSIKPDDRILILGTATEPWLAKNAKMFKIFPSVILIPRTDYGSLSFILTKILMNYHGVSRDFNVHSVAQALRGYDIPTIKKAIKELMTGQRIAELTHRPLEPMEIVSAVIDSEQVTYTDKEDYEMYKQWYNSYSPWGEKYNYYMTMLESQFAVKLKLDKKKEKK